MSILCYSELATQLSASDIEGVYETQVPPIFRVVTSLGCVCSLKRSYSKKFRSGVRGNCRGYFIACACGDLYQVCTLHVVTSTKYTHV